MAARFRRQFSVEIFLPTVDGGGGAIELQTFQAIKARLADRYGGVTAHLQAPAEGLWSDKGRMDDDQVVILEVMVDELDPAEWAGLQGELEAQFEQQEILIRASEVQRLAKRRPQSTGSPRRS